MTINDFSDLSNEQRDQIKDLLHISSARALVSAVGAVDDIEVLRAVQQAETARKPSRPTVLGACELRMDHLMAGSVAEPVVKVAKAGSPADRAMQIASAAEAEAIQVPERPVEPGPVTVDTDPVAEQPVERSEAQTCAAAFFKALASQNVTLVAALLAEVRREGANDDEMAKALTHEFMRFLVGSDDKAAARGNSGHKTKTAAPSRMKEAAGIPLTFQRNEWSGNAIIGIDGSFTITSGRFNPIQKRGSKTFQDEKNAMIEDGRAGTNGSFNIELNFLTPSAAASFICGDTANGNVSWKDAQGRTLGEIIG